MKTKSDLLSNARGDLLTASSASKDGLESFRLYYQKGANPFCRGNSESGSTFPRDWLLTPMNDSEVIGMSGDHLLAEATAKFLADERKASLVDRLSPWVKTRDTVFSIFEAYEAIYPGGPKPSLSIKTRIGVALKEIGCIRFEKKTRTTRHWYHPPKR